MARRTPKQQSKHDRKVRQVANSLRRDGWRVEADIPGFDRPGGIGKDGRILDVLATKRGAERIIEVETQRTVRTDSDQHATFRRSAGQKPRRSFKIEEA